MKKTLERLKKDAMSDLKTWAILMKRMLGETKENKLKLNAYQLDSFIILMEFSANACMQLTRYVQALEDYGYELDEKWDKLLKSIEEAQQPKSVQTKEKTKKYIG